MASVVETLQPVRREVPVAQFNLSQLRDMLDGMENRDVDPELMELFARQQLEQIRRYGCS
jgi:hypothetical protein